MPQNLKLGEVISHKRYFYRGVIVSIDDRYKAPDDWYQANQTQPNRNQPWCHILVDGSQQVTYVAQSNLEYDQLGSPVVHPMLNLFFYGHDENENKYLRNEIPWDPGKPPDAPLLLFLPTLNRLFLRSNKHPLNIAFLFVNSSPKQRHPLRS